MKNIVLTGMMGCGKTTLANMLGKVTGRTVVDTDDLVEQQAGMTISEMFAQFGESYMRDIETQVCRQLSAQENLIIACGGGLPLREENRRLLRETGTVFFLHRDPAVTYDTMDKSGRPLAQQGKDAFLQRFTEREPVYRGFAHIIIENNAGPREALAEILKNMEEEI